MLSYKDFNNHLLSEKFVNIVGFQDDKIAKKEEYALQVWDMLNKSYSKIGGIKGSGFESTEAMAKKIRFWKLGFKNKELKMVILYKDKGGRKMVALGTDGSPEAKTMLANVLKHDLKRAYKEISDGVWKFSRNAIGDDVLLKFAIPVSKVKQLMKGKEILSLDQVPAVLVKKIEKSDPFYKYYYGRKIGGSIHIKIMVGVEGLDIFDK